MMFIGPLLWAALIVLFIWAEFFAKRHEVGSNQIGAEPRGRCSVRRRRSFAIMP